MPDTSNKQLLHRACELAAKGHGCAEPNPMVGCIIVNTDGKIVGSGYHERCGESHAEVNALLQAGLQAKGSTAFITLEPCNHYGRTGPCSQALLDAEIAKVVIGCKDPNSKATSGGDFLSNKGVKVIFEEDNLCNKLIAPFVHRLQTGLPWVTCKWAQTSDGYIETPVNESSWISCETSQQLVHRERGCVDAIVVGVGTVVADDPNLTVRGAIANRIPLRVIVDPTLRTPPRARVLDGEVPTLIAHKKDAIKTAMTNRNVSYLELPEVGGSLDLRPLFAHLVNEYDATNIIVEGGKTLFQHIFDQQLANELWIFTSTRTIGNVPLQNMTLLFEGLDCTLVDQDTCGDDSVCRYLVK